MALKILVTGGTFDKEYDEITGKLYFKETHMKEILRLGRSQANVRVKKLMLMDSLDMKSVDREIILKNCKSAKEEQIVVTHGTDTMTRTARVIEEGQLKKTIVLTGAMIPYKFGSSDGLFNLGSAIAYAQALPYGVYIAMNGRCFKWNKVKKNKSTGMFEEIAPDS
jgi:L-asparaginase